MAGLSAVNPQSFAMNRFGNQQHTCTIRPESRCASP